MAGPGDVQRERRGDQSEDRRDDERRGIAPEERLAEPGAERRDPGAELMGGEDPPEHEPDPLATEVSAVSATVGGTVATQSSP